MRISDWSSDVCSSDLKALQDAIQEIADETTPRAALETASPKGDQAAPGVSYQINLVKSQNWNQVWESNFQPVTIGDECRIRASFHAPDPAFPLEIQIDPKMSFGTGHHETTWLMAAWLLEIARAGKLIDRKSGVEGKSVAVGVVFGGRRFNQKQK